MFHWIPEYVVHMTHVIVVIADRMFPEPSLPYSPFTFCNPNFRPSFGAGQLLHKPYLDGFPAIGKIIVSLWQGPNRVHGSSNTTKPSKWKGRLRLVKRTASRQSSIWLTSKSSLRSNKFTVKNTSHPAPGNVDNPA